MSEFLPGGRRRIDRVLDPGFLDGIGALSLDEVRRRRADADQEEVDLSYARRLLQGRIDILRAERDGLHGGGHYVPGTRSDEAIVEALKRILSDAPSPHHGGGRHMALNPSRVGEHRREAERAVADVGSSDPTGMDEPELDAAIARLSDIEAKVSRSRRSVQIVVDALTEEVARRYQGDRRVLADA